MATLQELRQQYPQYNDLSDQQLADSFYKKFYADMPREQFDQKIGLTPQPQTPPRQMDQPLIGTPGTHAAIGSFLQGTTMGGLDELAGLKNKLMGGNFEQGRAAEAANEQQFTQQHPIANAALQLAGTVPTAAAAPGLGAESLLGRIGAGAVTGAGYGGISGALSADPGSRLTGAGEGAALGGAIGGAVPAISTVGGAVGRALGFGNPQKTANEMILRGMRNDQTSPAQLLQKHAINQTQLGGKPETIPSLAGENTKGVLRSVANQPGPAKETVRQNYLDMLQGNLEDPLAASGAAHRVGQDAADALGVRQSYDLGEEALKTQRKAASDPAYKALYFQNGKPRLVWNNDLADLLERPSVKAAWAKAQRIAGDEGITLPQVFTSNAQGQLTLNTKVVPDMQTWDYIKRGLDDVVQGQREPITNKIKTDAARASNRVRGELVDALDKAVPQYKQTRGIYAGPSRSLEAGQFGRDVLSHTPQEIRTELQRMGPSEREFFRVGVSQAIADAADKTRGSGDVMNLIANTRENRLKLGAAMNAKEFVGIVKNLGRERGLARSNAKVVGGSDTQPKLAEAQDLMNMLGGARDLATGQFGSLLNRVLNRAGGLTPEVGNALAPMLSDPDKTFEALKALQLYEMTKGKGGLAQYLVRQGAIPAGLAVPKP